MKLRRRMIVKSGAAALVVAIAAFTTASSVFAIPCVPTIIDCPLLMDLPLPGNGSDGGDYAPPPTPSFWLADVCEPNNGYSDVGEMTWESDADELGVEEVVQVYVGPYYPDISIEELYEGDWMTVGPGKVWTEADIANMLAAAGVTNVSMLWVRVSSSGYPHNLGDMIRNRAAHMDDICAE